MSNTAKNASTKNEVNKKIARQVKRIFIAFFVAVNAFFAAKRP